MNNNEDYSMKYKKYKQKYLAAKHNNKISQLHCGGIVNRKNRTLYGGDLTKIKFIEGDKATRLDAFNKYFAIYNDTYMKNDDAVYKNDNPLNYAIGVYCQNKANKENSKCCDINKTGTGPCIDYDKETISDDKREHNKHGTSRAEIVGSYDGNWHKVPTQFFRYSVEKPVCGAKSVTSSRFLSFETSNFVEAVVYSDQHLGIIQDSMFVVHNFGTQHEAQQCLAMRYPINIAGESNGSKEMESVLGYDVDDVKTYFDSIKLKPGDSKMKRTIAVAGFAYGKAATYSKKDDASIDKIDKISKIGIIHVYGVNLESKDSDDYKQMVSPEGVVNEELYKARVVEMVRQIVVCSEKLHEQFGGDVTAKETIVKIPMIGVGAFIEGLASPDEKQKCWKITLEAMINNLKPSKTNIKFQALILPRDEMNWVPTLTRLPQPLFVVKGNLFDASIVDETSNYVLVNAWDDKSLIGNGGLQDGSIDGWIVSKFVFESNPLITTAYLHNLWFWKKKHFTDANRFVYLEPISASEPQPPAAMPTISSPPPTVATPIKPTLPATPTRSMPPTRSTPPTKQGNPYGEKKGMQGRWYADDEPYMRMTNHI
jgi:hypothetical protein